MHDKKNKFNLPEGWTWISLEDILLKLTDGSHNPPEKQASGIPMLSAQNIEDNHISFENVRYICPKDFESEYVRANIEKGDVLLTIVGTIGRVAFVSEIINQKFAIQRSVALLKPTSFLDGKYLMYVIQSPFFQKELKNNSKGTAQKGIYLRVLKTLFIPIAPLSEQQIIVSQIDSLFSKLEEAERALKKAIWQIKIYRQALLKNAFEGKLTEQWRKENDLEPAKKLLENIEAQRQAIYELELQEWKNALEKWKANGAKDQRPSKPGKPIIPDKPTEDHLAKKWILPQGWEWTQLGFITFVTKLAGFEYTKFVKYTDKGDLPVIKAENVGKYGFKKTEYSKVIFESISHLKRSRLNGGELIIVFVGAGVGNVAVVPENYVFFLGPNIGMARPYEGINSKFLEYFFQSPRGKEMLLVSVKAVAQPSLSMSNIRQTPIAIPSSEEQTSIVDFLDSRFTLIRNLDKSINEISNNIIALKHSILKKAFEGRLVKHVTNESVLDLLEQIKEEKNAYLESQKQFIKSKPKEKKKMEEKKSVLEILKASNTPISVQQLWESSTTEGDIEKFYDEIKNIYDQIVEIKTETESLLSIKNENQ